MDWSFRNNLVGSILFQGTEMGSERERAKLRKIVNVTLLKKRRRTEKSNLLYNVLSSKRNK